VDNKINDEIFSTFHYYLEQHDIHPSTSLVFKTFSRWGRPLIIIKSRALGVRPEADTRHLPSTVLGRRAPNPRVLWETMSIQE
jgi:hypothetical protein